ncbi:MAG TPA: hypothetical protein VL358_01550 [Caulobacteraceae bacterium]|jgi:hypothetical protein|nr:hypothetical protein [Caulobacteraceae bacterium]
MYEAIKKILLVELPSLDIVLKIPLTFIIIAISIFILVALWRDPLRASALNPAAAARLERGTQAFFDSSGQFAPDRAVVFGTAKDIVRRMKTDPNVFQNIDVEIEARKRADNNWKFANELSAGKALVNALGLDVDTPTENKIFLQMPLPTGAKAVQPAPAAAPKTN